MSEELADLVRLVADLGDDQWPAIHHVSGWFLVKPAAETWKSFARTIRLRALAGNLYVPCDAELVPTLLEDEARALVRQRGLVFLPGGRMLGFLPGDLVLPENIFDVKRLAPSRWRALPDAPALASRLRTIELDLPEPPIEEILAQGGEDIGSEAPRPSDTSLPGRGIGSLAYGAGRGILWLGSALGLTALATLGARMIAGALAFVPRLSESVLGKQEAALNELLRQFREGKIEQALKRALPFGEDYGRGSVPAQDANLPLHNLRYQLNHLLGGGGRAALWYGGGNVQQELRREYHKAAEAATRAGDYRRAALIYGKLLGEYRLAADTLAAGGLHHDAALLYLKKLNDKNAAARAFAAAGELDRAVDLYRQSGNHVAAGDLYKSVGEAEMALAEYRVAAESLVTRSSNGFLQAGELMLDHAERPDLALEYFRTGWALRPHANAIACAMEMARILTTAELKEQLLTLMRDAEALFDPVGNELPGAQFFSHLARLAERKCVEDVREEIRDRALLGIANKLRQRAATANSAGNTVSTFLGQAKAWTPAVVSDADYAFRTVIHSARKTDTSTPQPKTSMVTWTHVGRGVVTAVCHATSAGHAYLGFENGDIACFRPSKNDVLFIPSNDVSRRRLLSLSVDCWGRLLVALNEKSASFVELRSFPLNESTGNAESYGLHQVRTAGGETDCRLTPLIVPITRSGLRVGLWDHEGLCVMRDEFLTPVQTIQLPGIVRPAGAFLLPPYRALRDELAILWFDADGVWSRLERRKLSHKARLGWSPAIREGSSLASAPLSWLVTAPNRVELAALRVDGVVCWARLQLEGEHFSYTASRCSTKSDYLAVSLVKEGVLAAVRRDRIEWIRCGANDLQTQSETPLNGAKVVACFSCHVTKELILACRDGNVGQMAIPP
jgi:tetratricopeptide (TPR) repeat protein